LVVNIMLAWNRGLAFSAYQGIVSPAYCVYFVIDDSYPKFLNYLVRSNEYTLYFKAISAGVIDSRLRIYPETFGRLFCGIPPLPEQHAIASFLDRETAKIDALIAEQQRLIELLAEKRQTVISRAVTKGLNPNARMKDSGVEWLGQVPEHWEVKRIKRLASVISKGTTPSTVGAEFTIAGIRFLKAENITEAGVVEQPEFYISEEAHAILSRGSLDDGDVLVVIAGATTGKSAVLSKHFLPANTNQAVCYIRPKDKRFSPYISQWLGTRLVRNTILLAAVQSAQPNLSMEDLGNIPIPVPPLAELKEILFFLDYETTKLDTLTAEANRAIELLQERRSALISAAVTGQIDVRKAVNN
jgi:type I restriction enzyme S subunit